MTYIYTYECNDIGTTNDSFMIFDNFLTYIFFLIVLCVCKYMIYYYYKPSVFLQFIKSNNGYVYIYV